MNFVDIKYISLLSPRLEKFQKKDNFLWNFRCPYCGDSKKNRNKARGFVYRTKADLFYKCHNCSVGASFSNLLKYVDTNLHKEYILEKYKEGQTSKGRGSKSNVTVPNPKFDFKPPVFKTRLGNLKTFAELDKKHPAVQYLFKRKLPRDSWNDIYYCSKFFEFSNTIVENKFPTLKGDHPRILIPFRNKNGQIFGYQGRCFGKETQKYITIIFNNSYQKLFGVDRLNTSKTIYIVEGPFDSQFIDNCIAVAQSDLQVTKYKNKSVLIPDNEPRNREICKQIEKYISNKYSVVIWPRDVKEKDINDMILSGMTKEELQLIIQQNTYSGLTALTEFNKWKKV